MTNEVEVYFALKGVDFDPEAFTKLSGLTPTDVFRKGEPGRNGEKTHLVLGKSPLVGLQTTYSLLMRLQIN